MESIVLAISGLSLLGVSTALRRAAERHIPAAPKSKGVNCEVVKKVEFTAARDGRRLQSQVPVLLSPEVSSVLE